MPKRDCSNRSAATACLDSQLSGRRRDTRRLIECNTQPGRAARALRVPSTAGPTCERTPPTIRPPRALSCGKRGRSTCAAASQLSPASRPHRTRCAVSSNNSTIRRELDLVRTPVAVHTGARKHLQPLSAPTGSAPMKFLRGVGQRRRRRTTAWGLLHSSNDQAPDATRSRLRKLLSERTRTQDKHRLSLADAATGHLADPDEDSLFRSGPRRQQCASRSGLEARL